MTTTLLGVLFAVACSTPEPVGELRVDGPARVRVDTLGPVEAPGVVLEDGTATTVAWTAHAPGVVELEDGQVVAVGPGEARVSGEVDGKTVDWVLVVDPAVVLSFLDAPSSLVVGEAVVLNLAAKVGPRNVDPGAVQWVSSDPSVATVSQGEVMAMGEGVAYLTAKAHGSQAMVELEVVPE